MSTEIIVDCDVAVPMRDGTVLRADVYRPADGRPAPTLMQRTPYSKDQLVGTIFVMNPMRAAKAGYAVVVQDVRGRFKSEGEFYPFVNEAADGFDSVEWAAAQPWSSGKVGMYGSSYMAAAQWQAAKATPPHLVTITPFQASADYREGRSYRAGAFELGTLLSISMYALGAGSMARLPVAERRPMWDALRRGLDDISGTARAAVENRLEGSLIPEIIPYFFDWMDHDQPDEFWDRIDVTKSYERIDMPVLHVSCWFDQYLVGTIRNFNGMRQRAASQHARDNQHLMIGPWGHYAPRTSLLGTARIGDLDMGVSAVSDLDAVLLSWFDKWLKDPPVEGRAIAPVRYFVTGANSWRNLDVWPPESGTLELFLHSGGNANSVTGDGTLDRSAPAADEPADTYTFDPADPVPTCGGAHLVLESSFPQGAVDQRDVEARDDVLVYTTDVLTDDVEVLGPVTLHLTVQSTAPNTDFDATVADVHPDGRSLKMCDGVLRTEMNQDGLDGAPARIVIELGDIGHRFFAGHRIRLQVTSSSFPRYDVNPNNGLRPGHGTPVVAQQTVLHSPDHPSSLRLPVR